MKTKAQEIRDIFNKANPSRLELGFGVEIYSKELGHYVYLGSHPNRNISSIIANGQQIREEIEKQHVIMDNDRWYCESISSQYTKEDNSNFDFVILGKPVTLFECTQMVTDKHKLLDMWQSSELLDDQTEEVSQWVMDNLLHKRSIDIQ